MKRTLLLIACTAFAATNAMAQTTAPSSPTPPAGGSMPSAAPSLPTTPPASTTTRSMDWVLTDAQAKEWIGKRVYSSDGSHLGEVAAFIRDSSGKVTELHADVGGFLGIGETRVMLKPSEFTMTDSRINLTKTAEQAKALPKVVK